jgi:hypothetical protein
MVYLERLPLGTSHFEVGRRVPVTITGGGRRTGVRRPGMCPGRDLLGKLVVDGTGRLQVPEGITLGGVVAG